MGLTWCVVRARMSSMATVADQQHMLGDEWDAIPQHCVTSMRRRCHALYGSSTCYWGLCLLNQWTVKLPDNHPVKSNEQDQSRVSSRKSFLALADWKTYLKVVLWQMCPPFPEIWTKHQVYPLWPLSQESLLTKAKNVNLKVQLLLSVW